MKTRLIYSINLVTIVFILLAGLGICYTLKKCTEVSSPPFSEPSPEIRKIEGRLDSIGSEIKETDKTRATLRERVNQLAPGSIERETRIDSIRELPLDSATLWLGEKLREYANL